MYGEFVRRERKIPTVVPLETEGSIRSMTHDATPFKVASVLRSWEIREDPTGSSSEEKSEKPGRKDDGIIEQSMKIVCRYCNCSNVS
jgi:hypothetical protein